MDPSPSMVSDDLIEEVLYYLPVKTVFQLKCLSKKWLSNISHHCFARRYSSQREVSWGLLFQQSAATETPLHFISITHETSHLSLDFLPHPTVYLVAASNDLVLCSPTKVYQTLYYVVNPITRKWVTLPHSLSIELVTIYFFCLNSDYDGGSPSFTVVRAFQSDSTAGIMEIETFSSSSGEWIISQVPHPSLPNCFFQLQQTLYWLDSRSRNIITFNLTQNHCRSIALPENQQNYRQNLRTYSRLGVSKGEILYMEACGSRSIFRVWVLEDTAKGEWSLEHSIYYQLMVAEHPSIVEEFSAARVFIRPLHFHPFSRHLVILGIGSQMVSYNLISKKLEKVLTLSRIQESIIVPYLRMPWPTHIEAPSWKTPSPALVLGRPTVRTHRFPPLQPYGERYRERLRQLRLLGRRPG